MTAQPDAPQAGDAGTQQAKLVANYREVRTFSERIADPLTAEDCVIQSIPDVSPTRWHLAHTTWFFETFVLKGRDGYQPFDDRFEYLFNSYYNSVGGQFPRPERGLLSRPTVDEVFAYRRHVDGAMLSLLESGSLSGETLPVVELGLHHEQQHQELMLTDIKHVFSRNPLFPAYTEESIGEGGPGEPAQFMDFGEGVFQVGHSGSDFAFDNESPRHRVFLENYSLSTRHVTAGEYLEFINDDGYGRPELWLSLGWHTVNERQWTAPLYWQQRDGEWFHHTLSGLSKVDLNRPVCHVSYFEADAFARWAGARLPTEFEWELASSQSSMAGIFATDLIALGTAVHPTSIERSEDAGSSPSPTLSQMFGGVWEWTSSPYTAYPGYAAAEGALGEYNGKFMCNQYVLRGGSCATPKGHIRPTYRNFFPPDARWQFSGIRLAR